MNIRVQSFLNVQDFDTERPFPEFLDCKHRISVRCDRVFQNFWKSRRNAVCWKAPNRVQSFWKLHLIYAWSVTVTPKSRVSGTCKDFLRDGKTLSKNFGTLTQNFCKMWSRIPEFLESTQKRCLQKTPNPEFLETTLNFRVIYNTRVQSFLNVQIFLWDGKTLSRISGTITQNFCTMRSRIPEFLEITQKRWLLKTPNPEFLVTT
jgi:hypothetical protein